jgi:predicted transcriptional regulator
MKTTIDISDPLFEQAKRLAEKTGSTLREIVENALRDFFKKSKKPSPSFRLRKHSFKGKGLVEGLSEGDWGRIRERAYEGRGG